jgi:hypothetical protein
MATGAIIAAVAMAASGTLAGIVQASAQKTAAEEQAKLIEYNAAVARNQAVAREQLQRREADIARRRAQGVLSSQRAKLAKGGVVLASGTPLLLQEVTAEEMELDALMIEYGADLTSSFSAMEQTGMAFESKVTRTSGARTARTSVISGILLGSSTGASTYASMSSGSSSGGATKGSQATTAK